MAWWKRQPKSFRVRAIDYVSEQDGPPERDLKTALGELFVASDEVQAAFLLRVRLPKATQESVMLVVRAPDADRRRLVKRITHVFQQHFGSNVSLDISFMTLDDVARAEMVASAFYRR